MLLDKEGEVITCPFLLCKNNKEIINYILKFKKKSFGEYFNIC